MKFLFQVRYTWKQNGRWHQGRTVVSAASSEAAAATLRRLHPHIRITP